MNSFPVLSTLSSFLTYFNSSNSNNSSRIISTPPTNPQSFPHYSYSGGSIHSRTNLSDSSKTYVVFDFDETLGYFAQLNGLIQAIEKTFKTPLTEQQLFELLDSFPEVFRPKLFIILNYLKSRIIRKECDGVILYTNNQGPKTWCQFIIRYLNYKLQFNVISQVIAAWKIGNQTVERCRSSHNKSYSDLRRCARLPEKSRICFIDDRPHDEMVHDDITYVLVKPYFRKYYHDDMVRHFMTTKLAKQLVAKQPIPDEEKIMSEILTHLLPIKLDIDKTNITQADLSASEHIYKSLNSFFGMQLKRFPISSKTRKKFKRKKISSNRNRTQKHYKHRK